MTHKMAARRRGLTNFSLVSVRSYFPACSFFFFLTLYDRSIIKEVLTPLLISFVGTLACASSYSTLINHLPRIVERTKISNVFLLRFMDNEWASPLPRSSAVEVMWRYSIPPFPSVTDQQYRIMILRRPKPTVHSFPFFFFYFYSSFFLFLSYFSFLFHLFIFSLLPLDDTSNITSSFKTIWIINFWTVCIDRTIYLRLLKK